MSSDSAPRHDAPPHDPPPVYKSNLEEFEREGDSRLPFLLTYREMKLLGIAGVGFFLDAYDLFIINPVATMLQYRLYGGHSLPPGLEGFIKAAANIGSVIGQFAFGYSADYFGRKAVYGKELMLIIFATIGTICDPTGAISPNGALIWLGIWRIILGIGVGGDYPMSASVATDRANLRRRGTLLAYIFANQGWGSFVGALAFIIILLCYKHVMDVDGQTSKVDGVWRILVGLSLVPAFGTLYQRLTLPESTRYEESRKNAARLVDEESIAELKKKSDADPAVTEKPAGSNASRTSNSSASSPTAAVQVESTKQPVVAAKGHFRGFVMYFSEWRHAKVLIGTCTCWFLLDIAFYGINLNQNVVLQQIGFDGSSGTPWNRLFKIGVGNLIITALGFVPGYYVTILTIEKLGRKWIQIQGFLLAALFLAILAGKFHTLSTPAFVVCFAFLQFFFNFGANTTTYCYPAEVFPTRFRASAHGMSAACGKAGAIISALAFNTLTKKIGTPAVLWIFFGCCIAGAGFTLLLPEVRDRDPDIVYAEELRERDRLDHN
ncbi:MFS general substrate transporter [Dichomitus squalens]|uniref:MFS general substrate transporter n=1 Tax=Dichomitus squalens (strain LYAD-421) TaxID=732165 RepID=UPI00044116A5|nr:MFS general substrate transporter [Dichomitus squalens LYAD-421 SS1]EJF65579.1 MFS general substrate transporter [Dichomitus squalens LYAD-421 SS1]TBU41045.1 MFS general substrate transporter [Dichomitus squalens]